MLEAQQTDMTEAPVVPKRVLVAEDSPVTQDLLKLILSQRGHSVDLAEDGEQALSALQRHSYDVALIDFRLPKLDGLQVAQKYRSEQNGDMRSHLIAITADVEGLLSHKENCENFDQIIPKPLDVYEVCNVIEQTGPSKPGDPENGDDASQEEADASRERPELRRSEVRSLPSKSEPSWALGLELLRWPEDFDDQRFAAGALAAFKNLDEFDAILIRRDASLTDLASIWQRKPLHLFPVIDLTGSLGSHADYDASLERREDGEAVRRLIQLFHQRRAMLHRDLLTTSDLGEKLIARIFVQDTALKASYAPNSLALIGYNLALPSEDVILEAEKQCRSSFLTREFFDRFHVCYRCSSSRLHIREECPSCRSSQLREEAYIHHFKCGNQGVEADFRRADKLICPKCRQELSHFSVDYDKPGTAILCENCGHSGSEPAIGFVCMDCSAQFDSDQAGSRDIYSYKLTDEGLAFAQMGQALRGPGQRTIRFSDLPLDFVVALNAAAKGFNESETPFTVVNLSYENEREIIRETGLRQFAQARDLFLENLKNELGAKGVVVKGHSYDFCLLHGLGLSEAEPVMSDMSGKASSSLRLGIGVHHRFFRPEDFV